MASVQMKDAIELKYGIYTTVGSMLLFKGINYFVKCIGPPKCLLKREQREPQWCNIFVSYLHAWCTSCWALTSVALYPELVTDMMYHINYWTYFSVCFSTGYFTYDFLDNMLKGKFFANWEVSLHHIANLSVFYCNIYLKQNIGFNVLAFFLEVNTIFLHWRKLLQFVGQDYSSRKYILIKHLNILTVLGFRFPATFLITWAIFAFNDLVPFYLFTLVVIACPFMNVLNCVILYRLVRSDLMRGPGGQKSPILTTIRRDWSTILWNTPQALESADNKKSLPDSKENINGHSNGHFPVNGIGQQISPDLACNGHTKSS